MTRIRMHNLLRIGGEGGDRTHGPVARTAVFETARFGHSRTSPRSHPPTPGAITPAHPEPAKTGFWPVGRAPSRAHPLTPGPPRRTLFPWLAGPENRDITGND